MHSANEMVSLGDTAISLHILQLPEGGGVFWVRSDLDSARKIRVLNFLGGRGVLGKVSFGIWKEN